MKRVLMLAALIAAFVLVVFPQRAQAAEARCDWTNPGSNPLSVHPASVLGQYADIGAAERQRVAGKMRSLKPDDVIEIHRDKIISRNGYEYDPELRDMFWGAGRMCRGVVDRSKWKPGHVEVAMVYFTSGDPTAVPTSCRNTVRPRLKPKAGSRTTQAADSQIGLLSGGPGFPGLRFPPSAFSIPPAPATVPSDPPQLPPLVPLVSADLPQVQITTLRDVPAFPAMVPPVPPTLIFVPVSPIPEPHTLALMAVGLFVLVLRRRNANHD